MRAAARAADMDAGDPTLSEAAEASEGSVSRALTLLGGDALKLQQRTAALLAMLPRVDPRELHALGEQLPLSDRVALAAFVEGVERWISGRLRTDSDANANLPRLARLAEVWEKIVRAARAHGGDELRAPAAAQRDEPRAASALSRSVDGRELVRRPRTSSTPHLRGRWSKRLDPEFDPREACGP